MLRCWNFKDKTHHLFIQHDNINQQYNSITPITLWDKQSLAIKNKLGQQSQGLKIYIEARKNQLLYTQAEYILSALGPCMGFNLQVHGIDNKSTNQHVDIDKIKDAQEYRPVSKELLSKYVSSKCNIASVDEYMTANCEQ